jgi:hypothetical protein
MKSDQPLFLGDEQVQRDARLRLSPLAGRGLR